MTIHILGRMLLGFFGLAAFGIFLVVWGTMKKTKWGINLKERVCPRCGTKLAWVRRPANFRQAMWGGSTCAVCGLETDKWARPVE